MCSEQKLCTEVVLTTHLLTSDKSRSWSQIEHVFSIQDAEIPVKDDLLKQKQYLLDSYLFTLAIHTRF